MVESYRPKPISWIIYDEGPPSGDYRFRDPWLPPSYSITRSARLGLLAVGKLGMRRIVEEGRAGLPERTAAWQRVGRLAQAPEV